MLCSRHRAERDHGHVHVSRSLTAKSALSPPFQIRSRTWAGEGGCSKSLVQSRTRSGSVRHAIFPQLPASAGGLAPPSEARRAGALAPHCDHESPSCVCASGKWLIAKPLAALTFRKVRHSYPVIGCSPPSLGETTPFFAEKAENPMLGGTF